ncbi:MAG: zf-HC2 domain-containing protein [Pyrinomonadaceae bacterium]
MSIQCQEFKQIVDSYLSDELLIETNHEMLRHLENCSGCRGVMSDRRHLKLQLRRAVINAPDVQISPIFTARTTANLREMALQPGAWERLITGGRYLNMRPVFAGFAALLAFAIGAVVWLNVSNSPVINARLQGNNVNSALADAVRASWTELTAHAVGDHENCALEFNLSEKPISLDEASVKYGAYNKGLDKVIVTALQADPKDQAPDVELMEAHSCVFEDRRFAHLVLKHNGEIVSLLVSDTDLPGTEDIQTAHFERAVNAAGFQTGHHAVFVVSKLSDAENTTLARTVGPAVRSHFAKLRA